MSTDIFTTNQSEIYDDDDEEIQLMDTDETNLNLEEQQLLEPTTDVVEKPKEEEEEKREIPSLLVIEKLKVYIRDGPDSHHVDTILANDKYYELPTKDELALIELTEEKANEIWQSLNLTADDFRTSLIPGGNSRPESLYVRGVTNMSTQEIFNCFEEFKPIGIEWISDHSCNVFWHDSLTPLQLLSIKSVPGPCISHRRPVNYDHAMRLSKRKASEMTDSETNSIDIALPPGHWREGNFPLLNKPESTIKFYLRYTTLDDRKARGAENHSEYYRQYGNPNYDNMTGLISRTRKRALNAMKTNRFRNFTVVKSSDPTSVSSSIVEEVPIATEDNTTDAKVKFTVVLPPKKGSPSKEEEEEEDHRSKRQRRRSWNDDHDNQRRRDKTHFTVTMDAPSKHGRSRSNRTYDDEDSTPVIDAREILERKRRQRK
ncbi:hypothetical protein I4U23_031016 [Adineta vaga]|nr:hypothetical protein I4U23_031016 [Adineta vaga]